MQESQISLNMIVAMHFLQHKCILSCYFFLNYDFRLKILKKKKQKKKKTKVKMI